MLLNALYLGFRCPSSNSFKWFKLLSFLKYCCMLLIVWRCGFVAFLPKVLLYIREVSLISHHMLIPATRSFPELFTPAILATRSLCIYPLCVPLTSYYLTCSQFAASEAVPLHNMTGSGPQSATPSTFSMNDKLTAAVQLSLLWCTGENVL